MRPRCRLVAVLLLTAAFVLPATRARPAPSRVLMVTYSAGYQHDVVRRPAAVELSTAERVVLDLGRRSGRFDVTHVATREEVERLTPADVRAHRAISLLHDRRACRCRPWRATRSSSPFVTAPDSSACTVRRIPGTQCLSTMSSWAGPSTVTVAPACTAHRRGSDAPRHVPPGESLELADEIYQFRAWSRPAVHVLLSLDPRSVDVGRGKRSDGDYALAWTKAYGRGPRRLHGPRHEPGIWADRRFQAHLLGAIQWALGGR